MPTLPSEEYFQAVEKARAALSVGYQNSSGYIRDVLLDAYENLTKEMARLNSKDLE